MELGIGLDASLGLSFQEQAETSREAALLGYTSIWTPETAGHDGFQICLNRWLGTKEVVPGGVTTGIAVSPVALRTPVALAMGAGTVSQLTDGRFILGIGSGALHTQSGRTTYGMGRLSVIGLMREYLTSLQSLLGGDEVTLEGDTVVIRGVRLAMEPPPRTPVYLGALGPEMLRLGGELADGVALNWCMPEQIAWSRDRVVEGAARSGRDPAMVKVVEYIRVCVDDDEDLARRSFARAMLGYALGRPGTPVRERGTGYRAHFERMGFADDLAHLDEMRAGGASEAELIDAFPADLARRVGYYGPAEGAANAIRVLSEGLDVAIVRVVAARPGLDAVEATLRACAPAG